MDGNKDNIIFVEQNKSLMSRPKKNLFEEYIPDLNYYFENFDFLKKEIKNKSPSEINIFKKNISEKINKYLKEIFPENKNEIDEKISQIAENLDENNLTEDEFNYLITKFETRFNQYKNWISNGHIQNYKKVGEEYEDRYCYI